MVKTDAEIIQLNLKRVMLSLKNIYDRFPENVSNVIKEILVYKNGELININDIDFKRDCIFICEEDLLGLVSYLGIVKRDHINLRDTTLSGEGSRIRTSYMIANAVSAKGAMFADRNYESMEERDIVNYMKKDLVIWDLPKIIATGTEKDEKTNIQAMLSILEQRILNKKINWLFFRGSEIEYQNKYNFKEIQNLYIIKFKEGTKVVESKSSLEKSIAKYALH